MRKRGGRRGREGEGGREGGRRERKVEGDSWWCDAAGMLDFGVYLTKSRTPDISPGSFPVA